MGNRFRTPIFKFRNFCWAYVCRKTRKDALTEETKRLWSNIWMNTGTFRPTGNKAGMVGLDPKRTIVTKYIYLKKHKPKYTLIFLLYINAYKYSSVLLKIVNHNFIHQVRPKDRKTCCCRYHVQTISAV